MTRAASFCCPLCGQRSYDLHDVRERHCRACRRCIEAPTLEALMSERVEVERGVIELGEANAAARVRINRYAAQSQRVAVASLAFAVACAFGDMPQRVAFVGWLCLMTVLTILAVCVAWSLFRHQRRFRRLMQLVTRGCRVRVELENLNEQRWAAEATGASHDAH